VTASEWWWVVAIVVAVLAAVAYQVPVAAKWATSLAALAVAALSVGFLVLP
jgi:hypothetical protein